MNITHYHITVPRKDNRPESEIRIAFLSDLHNYRFEDGGAALARQVQQQHPDLILSGGDLIIATHGRWSMDHIQEVLQKLSDIAPVYTAYGNHEQRLYDRADQYPDCSGKLEAILQQAGVRVLRNETEVLMLRGMKLSLTAYEPPIHAYRRIFTYHPKTDELIRSLGRPSNHFYRVMLCHHPDLFKACARWGADLVLSGHFHGGIIRVPYLGGLVGGSLIPFPRYDRGSYEYENSRMIVSAGMGCHSVPFRINNPAEIVMLHIA